MPRQPLWKITQKLTHPIMIGPKTFAERPQLAHIVCQIITGWAQVEGSLSVVFARYAGMKVDMAVSTYLAVEGFRAQGQMLDAAAKCALPEDDFYLYSATMKFVKRQYSVRNEMAHWMWGITDDFPDALMIIEPISHRKFNTLLFANSNPIKDMPKIAQYRKESDRKIFLYRQTDLQKHAEQMFHAEVLADRLQFLVAKPPHNETEARVHLLSQPDIARDYQKIKEDVSKQTASAE